MWSSSPVFRASHLIPGSPVHASLMLPLWLCWLRSREGKMNFDVLWVFLSSNVCHVKNEREGGQRIFQMESSEEGTTRLPLHSDVAVLSEHWARSQEHKLLPALQWRNGLAGWSLLAWDGDMFRQAHRPRGGGTAFIPKAGVVCLEFLPFILDSL